MRRAGLILLLLPTVIPAAGQEVFYNVDGPTTAAIVSSAIPNVAAEALNDSHLDNILEYYGLANVSSAIIFGSALAERNARTDITGWDGAEENYYYKRIYSLVRDAIIPKTLSVALLCIKDPAQVFYWGRFLFEVCNDTKNLCSEFESIVTNSRLSFKDLPFIEINEDILPFCTQSAQYFQFLEPSLDQLAGRIGSITLTDLKGTFSSLGGMTDLLKSGVTGLTDFIKEDMEKNIVSMTENVYDLKERFSLVLISGNEATNELSSLRSQYMEYQSRLNILRPEIDKGVDNPAVLSEFAELSERSTQLIDRLKTLDMQTKNIYAAVGGAHDIISEAAGIMASLVSSLTPEEVVTWIFRKAQYDIGQWVSDYLTVNTGQYYTQMWRIQREKSGTRTLITYNPPLPPTGSNASHWVPSGECLVSSGSSHSEYPSEADNWSSVLANTLHISGAYVYPQGRQTSSDGTVHEYVYDTTRRTAREYSEYKTAVLGTDYKVYDLYHAYAITVTDNYHLLDIKFEKLFDSSRDNMELFMNMMNALVQSYNMNDSGYVYSLVSDQPHYYPAADLKKLTATDEVVISSICSERFDIDKGTTQYKCDQNHHDHFDCALLHDAAPFGNDINELYAYISRLEAEVIPSLQRSIVEKHNAEDELVRLISRSPASAASAYRQQLQQLRDEIAALTIELKDAQSKLQTCQEALAELNSDNEAGDNSYRIPAIERDLADKYNLKWIDSGSLDRTSGVYTRHAGVQGMDDVYTFQCRIQESTAKQYLFGFIRIHRARVGLSWSLFSDVVTTSIVNRLDLRRQPEDSRKEYVDDAVRSAQQQYPDCEITLDYIKNDPIDSDNSEDTYHLLWASDRLEAARRIESRLVKLYASLVNLERMLSIKVSVVDMLTNNVHIDTNVGRSRTMLDKIFDNWKNTLNSVNVSGVQTEPASSEKQD